MTAASARCSTGNALGSGDCSASDWRGMIADGTGKPVGEIRVGRTWGGVPSAARSRLWACQQSDPVASLPVQPAPCSPATDHTPQPAAEMVITAPGSLRFHSVSQFLTIRLRAGCAKRSVHDGLPCPRRLLPVRFRTAFSPDARWSPKHYQFTCNWLACIREFLSLMPMRDFTPVVARLLLPQTILRFSPRGKTPSGRSSLATIDEFQQANAYPAP
jgi:hypothetical protein